MITVKISHDDAICLQAILQSDKHEYCDGIVSLKEIMQTEPDRLIGSRKQTPSEAIETTQKAIDVLDRVLDQLTQGNEKRNQEIFNLKENGMTYSQIASKFNLSSTRVSQIYHREKRYSELAKNHAYTFWNALIDTCETRSQATRIYTCLKRAGILSEIENNNKTLDSYSDETLLSIRHFGTISLIFSRRANKRFLERK